MSIYNDIDDYMLNHMERTSTLIMYVTLKSDIDENIIKLIDYMFGKKGNKNEIMLPEDLRYICVDPLDVMVEKINKFSKTISGNLISYNISVDLNKNVAKMILSVTQYLEPYFDKTQENLLGLSYLFEKRWKPGQENN